MQEEATAAGLHDERDINDVFNDIFLTEERVYKDGFREGVEHGRNEQSGDAFHLGYRRGAEIGSEVGYYIGVTESYLSYFEKTQSQKDDKIIKELEVLKKLLEQFPRESNIEVDILEVLNGIRMKFKKVCAHLKIRATFPKPNELSF